MKKTLFLLLILLGRFCDAGTLFVSLLNGNIAAINTNTGRIIHNIAANAPLSGLTISPNEKSLFSISTFTTLVNSFNAETMQLNFSNTDLGPGAKVGYAPDNTTLYVPYLSLNPHSLAVFTNTINNVITLSGRPTETLVHPTNPIAYALLNNASLLSIIDTNTETELFTVALGGDPSSMALSPDGSQLAITFNSLNLVKFYSSVGAFLKQVTVGDGPAGLVYGDNGYLYVTNTSSSTVSAVNTSTDTVEYTYISGFAPTYITYSSDENKIYVSNTFATTVSVFDGLPNASPLSGTISVGSNPLGIAYMSRDAFMVFGNIY